MKKEKAELLKKLNYLSLAITQTAAYMTKQCKTISQYLTLYYHSDSAKV